MAPYRLEVRGDHDGDEEDHHEPDGDEHPEGEHGGSKVRKVWAAEYPGADYRVHTANKEH